MSANTVIVDRKDPRFDTLNRGNNLRFPSTDAEAASRIVLCTDATEIADALHRIVSAGIRPTVRSGGHCYEDFVVNNPNGAIIDLSLHNKVDAASPTGPFRIAPGARLGEIYQTLYKRYNVTIPAGSCSMVGAGGHIAGGGYGLLSRQHGLTADWISALDLLTVDPHGKITKRTVDSSHEPDLFRACRGAGGGNFGIITNFYFDRLPAAPTQVAQCTLDFPWTSLTQERFNKLLTLYASYWDTRGRDAATWGLSSVMTIDRRHTGSSISIAMQYCSAEGNARDLGIVHEFIDHFSALRAGRPPSAASDGITRRPWLEATLAGGDTGGIFRAKYKSTYMTKPFAEAELHTLYKFLTAAGTDAQGFVLSIDAYGGATNAPARTQDTAISQRASIMKLQWQCYWEDEAEDHQHLKFMDDFYTAMYTGSHVPPQYQGTPFGDRYEGCYMNYADADMLRYNHWPELYYGSAGLYPFLQQVKRTYDSNNIFHNSMSIRPTT